MHCLWHVYYAGRVIQASFCAHSAGSRAPGTHAVGTVYLPMGVCVKEACMTSVLHDQDSDSDLT